MKFATAIPDDLVTVGDCGPTTEREWKRIEQTLARRARTSPDTSLARLLVGKTEIDPNSLGSCPQLESDLSEGMDNLGRYFPTELANLANDFRTGESINHGAYRPRGFRHGYTDVDSMIDHNIPVETVSAAIANDVQPIQACGWGRSPVGATRYRMYVVWLPVIERVAQSRIPVSGESDGYAMPAPINWSVPDYLTMLPNCDYGLPERTIIFRRAGGLTTDSVTIGKPDLTAPLQRFVERMADERGAR